MTKVKIFKKNIEYELFRSVSVGFPLSKVSINEDGDIFIVSSAISAQSFVYKYSACS